MSSDSQRAEFEALVKKAQSGDERAMGELIEKTQERLFRFCYYLCGEKQLAQDICQDAYVKILEELKTLKEPGAFWGWVFRATKNHFLDFVRSPKNDEPIAIETVPNSEALKHDPGLETILQVRTTLQQFDPESRLLLLLVDQEGNSYAEAAEIIGISENALRSRLHRVREEFVKKFEKA